MSQSMVYQWWASHADYVCLRPAPTTIKLPHTPIICVVHIIIVERDCKCKVQPIILVELAHAPTIPMRAPAVNDYVTMYRPIEIP